MNIKGGIPEMIKELKNSVANQNNLYSEHNHDPQDEARTEEGGEMGHKNPEAMSSLNNFQNTETGEHESQEALFLAKIYRQRLTMFGMEMFVSVCISYGIAWGIGYVFTLSSFSRIILGTLLAFAVHALAVYRMIKR